jgi:hypothetical protein
VRLEAYGVLLFLVTAAFLAASFVPYRVDTDTGFQLRSLQQWIRGETPSPGTLRLPDADDLSRDALVWSSWWPPGLPFVYAPLAATGLPLAGALRVTSFLLFLVGAVGWMRLADGIALSRSARLLYAVSLAAYAVTLGGAASLRSADNLAFTAAPWLALLVLQPGSKPSYRLLLLCGMALGLSYWLKYTLFLVALSFAIWLAARLFLQGAASKAAVLRPVVLGLGFALPVAALLVINAWQSGSFTESATGARSIWKAEDPQSARLVPVALGVAGAPGLALFQSNLWITHLLYFRDDRLPFLAPLNGFQRLLLKSIAGLPGTAALIWALSNIRRNRSEPLRLSLAMTTTCGFYTALGAASLAVEYNYPANEPRYAVALMPLLHPFVLAGWLAAVHSSRRLVQATALAALTFFFIAPVAFAASDFVLNEIGDRLAQPYRPSSTGLYMPEISPRDIPEIQAHVAGLMRSPRDLVILAGPAGWGSSFMMWLETPWRTLPVTTFCLPLGRRYAEAADLRASRSLTSTRPVRVVLVASHSLEQQGWLSRLQSRFPQAKTWTPSPPIPGSHVGIWFSDLEVR